MRYAGTEGEKLQQFKEHVNNAVQVFVDALPNMKEKMAFKAFEIADISGEEAKNFADIILTQFAIRLKELVPETLDIYTYNGSIVEVDDGTQVWFHAENTLPGKAERIELPEDKDASAIGMLENKDETDVLIGASGMGHSSPEEHYISRATYDV